MLLLENGISPLYTAAVSIEHESETSFAVVLQKLFRDLVLDR